MHQIKLTVVVLALIAVSGCKLNLTADIYSTDMRAAMNGEADITSPATLAFEVPSVDKCDEHAAKIQEIMAGVLDDFTPKGCKRQDMESFLLADTQMPFFISEESWRSSDDLFGLLLVREEEPKRISAIIMLDIRKYETLTRRMNDEFHQTVDLGASNVTLVFHNDERKTVTYEVAEVFVNSEPIHGLQEFSLDRRHKANIQLSDVATAYLARKGDADGFALIEAPKEKSE